MTPNECSHTISSQQYAECRDQRECITHRFLGDSPDAKGMKKPRGHVINPRGGKSQAIDASPLHSTSKHTFDDVLLADEVEGDDRNDGKHKATHHGTHVDGTVTAA